MASGLQVFDAMGATMLDLSYMSPRLLGTATLTSSYGSIDLPFLNMGTPFIIAPTIPSIGSTSYGPYAVGLVWSIAGKTLTWRFDGQYQQTRSAAIWYGNY
ncbi:hypothetical protein KK141_13925 [Dyella sp. LX-66]|uniref:hypothetical protein n=1 Tax=unclassified Dyella TaxID=2634549 RepID=UPI001BDFAEAD|nr:MULTISPECIES: hypothetical protein [unclassified Dyella]MBT2116418.1 hypothetical protein [Dyella sp. LX-1]MBT2140639.1 hypothetical protein [Dyella sp. LX-66]